MAVAARKPPHEIRSTCRKTLSLSLTFSTSDSNWLYSSDWSAPALVQSRLSSEPAGGGVLRRLRTLISDFNLWISLRCRSIWSRASSRLVICQPWGSSASDQDENPWTPQQKKRRPGFSSVHAFSNLVDLPQRQGGPVLPMFSLLTKDDDSPPEACCDVCISTERAKNRWENFQKCGLRFMSRVTDA